MEESGEGETRGRDDEREEEDGQAVAAVRSSERRTIHGGVQSRAKEMGETGD